MGNFVWSNKVEGNNLCFFCANWKRKQFFCTDPQDADPVVVCKYYLPVGTNEFEIDMAMIEILGQML